MAFPGAIAAALKKRHCDNFLFIFFVWFCLFKKKKKEEEEEKEERKRVEWIDDDLQYDE